MYSFIHSYVYLSKPFRTSDMRSLRYVSECATQKAFQFPQPLTASQIG